MNEPAPYRSSLALRLMLVALGAALLIGCEREEIQQYRVPHEEAAPPTTSMDAMPMTAPVQPAAGPAAITYDAPAGWRDLGPGNMRIAAFSAGDEQHSVQITVTSFGGDVGGVAGNVRRWAGQVGAETPSDEQIAQMVKPYEGMAVDALACDITGPKGRIFVVFVQHDAATWFFKMTGPADAVDPQLPAMRQFLSSVRFVEQGRGDG